MNNKNLGKIILQNIVEKKFSNINEYCHSNLMGRLSTPNAFFTTYDNKSFTARLEQWFGPSDHFELIDSAVTSIGDIVSIRYKFKVHEDGQWFEVEQTLYCTITGDKAAKVNLLCSGFE